MMSLPFYLLHLTTRHSQATPLPLDQSPGGIIQTAPLIHQIVLKNNTESPKPCVNLDLFKTRG
uniref:Putative ovule protein n=1 Tax=Solanum chacoense TaxID=4108 RepID=A0A0V0H3B2_SOLCH